MRALPFPRDTRRADRVMQALLHGTPCDRRTVSATLPVLRREGLGPWVAYTLARQGEDVRPDRRYAAAHGLLVAVELRRALAALSGAGVPVLPLKGAELAFTLYPTPDCRPLADLDLQIESQHLDAALQALAQAGFQPEHDDPAIAAFHRDQGYDVPLRHVASGMLLELHHALPPDLRHVEQAMWDASQDGELLGLPVRQPDAAHRFVYLCAHLLPSGLEAPGKWLLDLVLLLRSDEARLKPSLRAVAEVADAWDHQLAVVLAAQVLSWRWRVDDLLPVAKVLRPMLRGPERRILRAVGRGQRPARNRLIAARRLAGRRMAHRRGSYGAVWCHPGVVALEMNISSDARPFWLYRMRHAFRRLVWALESL